MTTRRELFKIATGLGLTGVIPTTAERIGSMRLLDQKVSDVPVLDPATFADHTDGAATGRFGNDWCCAINAEEEALYRRRLEELYQALPELRNAGYAHPFTRYDEALFNFVQTAYVKGIQHGAAYEHLRRTVIGELSQCRTCWGVGLSDQGATCRSCGGTGVVATGVQRGYLGGGD